MTVPLRTMKSLGPVPYTETDTGAQVERSTACPACGGAIGIGQLVSRRDREWLHADCLTDTVRAAGAQEAWLVLGSQLAKRPGDFTRTEVRLIVAQLLRLAGGLPVPPWALPE